MRSTKTLWRRKNDRNTRDAMKCIENKIRAHKVRNMIRRKIAQTNASAYEWNEFYLCASHTLKRLNSSKCTFICACNFAKHVREREKQVSGIRKHSVWNSMSNATKQQILPNIINVEMPLCRLWPQYRTLTLLTLVCIRSLLRFPTAIWFRCKQVNKHTFHLNQ